VILGRKRDVDYQVPEIGGVSTEPATLNGETSAAISAGPVNDVNAVGISSVWSRILPPFDDFQASHIPVISVPTVRLEDADADDIYKNAFDNFIYQGTYDIFAHMEDKAGFFAVPAFTGLTQNDGITAETGDINLDETVGLKDLVLAMKIFTGVIGQTGYPVDYKTTGLDIGGDGKIGLEEVLYILGKTAQLR
jgi:hypothetical protein